MRGATLLSRLGLLRRHISNDKCPLGYLLLAHIFSRLSKLSLVLAQLAPKYSPTSLGYPQWVLEWRVTISWSLKPASKALCFGSHAKFLVSGQEEVPGPGRTMLSAPKAPRNRDFKLPTILQRLEVLSLFKSPNLSSSRRGHCGRGWTGFWKGSRRRDEPGGCHLYCSFGNAGLLLTRKTLPHNQVVKHICYHILSLEIRPPRIFQNLALRNFAHNCDFPEV